MAESKIYLTKGALVDYREWLEESRHGDRLVYFTGDLAYERSLEIPFEENLSQHEEFIRLTVLGIIADEVKVDALNGKIALTQRKISENVYEYRATRLRPERERLRQALEQSDAAGV